MKSRVLFYLELASTCAGFLVLLGPPAWQEVNRGVTYALLITLGIAAIAGLFLVGHLYRNQRQAPYE
jgi:hypothetical protein